MGLWIGGVWAEYRRREGKVICSGAEGGFAGFREMCKVRGFLVIRLE